MTRAGVVGLVDGVAEAHDPLAPLDRGADPGVGVVGGADRVEQCRAPGSVRRRAADRTARRWRHDGGAEVGAGRGDDPGGERRGVEAVVDGRDQVLLDGAGVRSGSGSSPVSM